MNTPDSLSARRPGIDKLDRAIVSATAHIYAANYQFLMLIREFDERAGWLKWSFASCVEWLHWRCGISPAKAREKVRIAHALKDLAEISAAFEGGALSYSRVQALTRVATPLNEHSLLNLAMTTTAARLEERCRQMRKARPESVADANKSHSMRSLTTWRNVERGTVTFTVEMPLEDSELLVQALEKAMAASAGNGPEFADMPFPAQQADALVGVAKGYLSGAPGDGYSGTAGAAEHYQVLVHVDAMALAGREERTGSGCADPGLSEPGRSDLPVESVRRISCDASVVTIEVDGQGEPLSVGRKQRTVPAAIRRALHARDRACSFPGCSHTQFLHAHHIKHWSQGGETSFDNLVLLCSAHHRLVHEGGYAMRRDTHRQWYFRRPDGRAVPACGYCAADQIDDELDVDETGDDRWGASAEAEGVHPTLPFPYAGVRDGRAAYRVARSRKTQRQLIPIQTTLPRARPRRRHAIGQESFARLICRSSDPLEPARCLASGDSAGRLIGYTAR